MKKIVLIASAVLLLFVGGWLALNVGRCYFATLSLKHFRTAVVKYAKSNSGRYPTSLQQIADEGFLGKNDIVYIAKGLPFNYVPPSQDQSGDPVLLTTTASGLELSIQLSGKIGINRSK